MKTLLLLIVALFVALLFATPALSALRQTPQTIERVELNGLDESRLSAELRADIQKLVGQPYSAQAIEALTQDIQVELPEYIAAASTQPGTQPDRMRVVVLVAKISDSDALSSNINSRYIVDAIEFEGNKVKISDGLNAELQKMVGSNVNSAELTRISQEIKRENRQYDLAVTWKLKRSAQPQHVNVVYEVDRITNTLNFRVLNGTYHSRQGFSGDPIFGFTYANVPVGTFTFDMLNSAEEFIERYSGYRVGYGRRGRPFSFGITYSSLRTQWKTNTLEADGQLPLSPGLYRLRDTLSGRVNWNHPLSRSTLLTVSIKADFTELEMQTPKLGFQKSNVARSSLEIGNFHKTDTEQLQYVASYEAATGTNVIDSDFIFARHEGKFDLTYSRRSHGIQFNFQAGRITQKAPMYERFSIGNAKTLRGWNKYEINPLGGDRMIYGSAGYRYKIITTFYDVGSVWDAGQDGTTRHSVGFRLGKSGCKNLLIIPHPECLSLTVGFPINGGDAKPSFIMGMGF